MMQVAGKGVLGVRGLRLDGAGGARVEAVLQLSVWSSGGWVGGLRLAHGTRHLGMEAQALPLLPLFMTSLHTQAPASLDSHDQREGHLFQGAFLD